MINFQYPLRRLLSAAALGLAAAASGGAAQAHQLWFEPEAQQAAQQASQMLLRYGELELNMHERSPGGLDRFVELQAQRLSAAGEQPLALSKQASGFAVAGDVGDSWIAIDRRYPMFDTKKDGKQLRTWWTPAGRWLPDLRPREPRLPLDIVPTGVTADGTTEFRIVFQGEPLPGATVTLSTPAGWTREAISDAEGKLRFPLPWQGLYVIGHYHLEDTAGERAGPQGAEPYQLEGYNTAVSFVQRSGLAALPMVAPKLPAAAKK
jgi:Domain of unknown function (DUF4198)